MRCQAQWQEGGVWYYPLCDALDSMLRKLRFQELQAAANAGHGIPLGRPGQRLHVKLTRTGGLMGA
jgi:hypothetical protein